MTEIDELILRIESEFATSLAEVKQDPMPAVIESFRLRWLGRKGLLPKLFSDLKTTKDRASAGKAINLFKARVEKELAALKQTSIKYAIDKSLERRAVDVSLPAHPDTGMGSLHPVTLMRQILLREFRRLGFTVWDGPELESDFYNFTALNFPDEHPSRDMQDTFFVKSASKRVLRTHTSNIQIHAMLQDSPPLRLVAPGRVYRCDNDATHSPMFHQIECVAVGEGVHFGHLKGLVDTFVKAVFGPEIDTRFRPSFFPFVEPGAEVDLICTICRGKGCRVCKQTGWLEIGGCGMIHPNVFEQVNYDSERYTGYAFGFGIDRMAMLAYGIPDLRVMFEGSQQFHRSFPIYAR